MASRGPSVLRPSRQSEQNPRSTNNPGNWVSYATKLAPQLNMRTHWRTMRTLLLWMTGSKPMKRLTTSKLETTLTWKTMLRLSLQPLEIQRAPTTTMQITRYRLRRPATQREATQPPRVHNPLALLNNSHSIPLILRSNHLSPTRTSLTCRQRRPFWKQHLPDRRAFLQPLQPDTPGFHSLHPTFPPRPNPPHERRFDNRDGLASIVDSHPTHLYQGAPPNPSSALLRLSIVKIVPRLSTPLHYRPFTAKHPFPLALIIESYHRFHNLPLHRTRPTLQCP